MQFPCNKEELKREINYILWTENAFNKKVKERHHLILDMIEKPLIMLVGDEDEFRRAAKGEADSKHRG